MRKVALTIVAILALLGCTATAQASSTSLAWVVKNCSSHNGWCGWQQTVNCENNGNWPDSPGQFYYGVQFAYGTMLTAERHTGVTVTAWPPTQIVNAIWTRDEAIREHYPDPWPNCPNP